MIEFLKNKFVIMGIIIVFIILLVLFILSLIPKASHDAIKFEDYTILEGHFGQIEKYDSSHAIEGYKGDPKEAYYINGKITSERNKKFTIITFDLYSRSNKFLGTAVAGLNEVKKGKTYGFKAVSLEKIDLDKIDHYKIKNIGNKVVK